MLEIIDVTKLLASRQLQFKKGEIDLLNQSVAMIPIDWIITLEKQLAKKNLQNAIYYAAKEMGVRWFKNMYDYFKISPEDVIKWGINVLSIAGWGKTSTPTINHKEKFYTVKLEESAEGKSFGKVGYAVDNFVRGCYASGARVLFGVGCDSVELHCVAEGSPFCEFIAQPTKKFDFKNPLVKKQLQLPKSKQR